MAAERRDLLERFRKAAERGERLRKVPCRWEGRVLYRRQCCDYVECHRPSADEAGLLVVNKLGCRVCVVREGEAGAEVVDREV